MDDASNPLGDLPDARPVVRKSQPYFGLVTFFLGVVLVLSLIGIAYYYYIYAPALQEANLVVETPNPETQTTTDPTANWKTYTDSNNTFSFRYPPAGQVSEQDGIVSISNSIEAPYYVFSVKTTNNSQGISTKNEIDNYISDIRNNKNNPGAAEWANRIEKTVKQPYSSGVINGLSFRRDQEVGAVTDSFVVIQATKDHVYTFSIHDGNGSVEQAQISLMDQILSTFKFTDQNQVVDTADWKTFAGKTIDGYPFTINYPEDWSLKDRYLFPLQNTDSNDDPIFALGRGGHDGLPKPQTTKFMPAGEASYYWGEAASGKDMILGYASISIDGKFYVFEVYNIPKSESKYYEDIFNKMLATLNLMLVKLK